MAGNKKTLVICIDRDDDLGEKAKVKGPVIGEKKCLEAANALILADPEDSDSNTMFAAVKTKRKIPGSEIAVITGDTDVGIKSDQELARQLKEVITKVKPTEAIVVTDGAEDEYILPVIQSFIPIISINRVIIRQSQNLESSYYMIKEFIQDVVRDPKLSRVFLGLPAVALLILAIFGSTGWRLVLGAVGVYLFIRGLQLEIIVSKIFNELVTSLKNDRASFFFYSLSVIFGIVAVYFGYDKAVLYGTENIVYSAIAFINGSVLIFLVAGGFAWLGKALLFFMGNRNDVKIRERLWRSVTILSLFFAIAITLFTASDFLLEPDSGIGNLLFSIALGFAAIVLSMLLERSQKKIKSA